MPPTRPERPAACMALPIFSSSSFGLPVPPPVDLGIAEARPADRLLFRLDDLQRGPRAPRAIVRPWAGASWPSREARGAGDVGSLCPATRRTCHAECRYSATRRPAGEGNGRPRLAGRRRRAWSCELGWIYLDAFGRRHLHARESGLILFMSVRTVHTYIALGVIESLW